MKRRKFLKATSGAAAAFCLPPLSIAGTNSDKWQYSHNSTPLETIIKLTGIHKTVNILQISDSHISCDNETDSKYQKFSTRMNGAYRSVKHFSTYKKVTPLKCFEELMIKAKNEELDLIALTGDIINYPSSTAVEAILKIVKETDIPYLYTAGNHDWHYEGMEGSSDFLRQEWIERRLKPFYKENPLFSSQILGGLNIVSIDNSTYQVNDEQLEFFKKQKSLQFPIVLFVHIPLYMPSMTICCGHPEWGAKSDKNYKIERRERWPEAGNSESTMEFIDQVMSTEKLAGIFTGHWHSNRTINYKDKYQHIAGSALNGQYRHLKFIPFET